MRAKRTLDVKVVKTIGQINDAIVESKSDPKIEVWEREIIRDFGSRLQMALGEMQSDFQKYKHENPTVREYFVGGLAQLLTVPSFIPKGITLGKQAQEFLSKVWTIALEFMDKFVKAHKGVLMIKSWTIGATVGFPIGVAGTFSVTFEE